jgi:hypothetical protein
MCDCLMTSSVRVVSLLQEGMGKAATWVSLLRNGACVLRFLVKQLLDENHVLVTTCLPIAKLSAIPAIDVFIGILQVSAPS